jgi:hypothetical protein
LTVKLANPSSDVVQKLQQGILITGPNVFSSSPRTYKAPAFVAGVVKNGVSREVEGCSLAMS